MFTKPLLNNDHLFSLHYSGFPPSCHNMKDEERKRTTQVEKKLDILKSFGLLGVILRQTRKCRDEKCVKYQNTVDETKRV
jgi:hypothetical protein